jgi:hypothetical protein
MKMRLQFFSILDSFMPIWLKLIPYQVGFIFCKNLFFLQFKNSDLWVRNSVQRRTLVFGLSDLDLTLLTSQPLDKQKFNRLCKKAKKLVPFMGEVNCYEKNHFDFLKETINTFEYLRDSKLQTYFSLTEKSFDGEKVVFLLRMLRSDKALLRGELHYRQRKWRDHFSMLELPLPKGLISADVVARQISQFFPNQEEIFKTLGTWLSSAPWREDLYHDHFGEHWKFLNPHLYLWFENNDANFTRAVSEFEKNILKRQIDWELFGLYSQRSWLDPENILIHINRLEKCLEHFQLSTDNIKLFHKSLN